MKKLVIILLVLVAVGASIFLAPHLAVFQQLGGSGPATGRTQTTVAPPPAISVAEVATAPSAIATRCAIRAEQHVCRSEKHSVSASRRCRSGLSTYAQKGVSPPGQT